MTLFKRIFGGRAGNSLYAPLYAAIVAEGRRPHWYAQGGVPDTLDGRFDMVSGVLALVLLRLEAEGEAGREPAARITELFVTDMDGQLRQRGIGDLVVGKHIGRMMSQLGGRLSAFRDGLAADGPDTGDLAGAIDRNLHRGADVSLEARTHAEQGLRALAARLASQPLPALLAGGLG